MPHTIIIMTNHPFSLPNKIILSSYYHICFILTSNMNLLSQYWRSSLLSSSIGSISSSFTSFLYSHHASYIPRQYLVSFGVIDGMPEAWAALTSCRNKYTLFLHKGCGTWKVRLYSLVEAGCSCGGLEWCGVGLEVRRVHQCFHVLIYYKLRVTKSFQ